MGKVSEFKLQVNPELRNITGRIDRNELKEIVEQSFRTQDSRVRQHLAQMCETVQYIAYGSWATKVRTDEGLARCGCPLASIADWVKTDDDWNLHEGRDVRYLSGFATYDRNMRVKFGSERGYLEVV